MSELKDSIVSYYDQVANRYGVQHGTDLYGCTWGIKNYYLPLIERFVPRGSEILEIGCGTGRFTEILKQGAAKIKAIDLSPMMIKVAQERNPGVEFHVGDCEKLEPFRDGEFSAVAAFNTFSYYPNKKRALASIHRVLKKDGIFFDLDMNALNPVYIMSYWMNRNEMKDWFEYIKESTRGNLAAMFDEAGFDVIHQDTLCWIPNALNKPMVSLLIPLDAILSRIPFIREYAMRVVVVARKR
ncbi:MAG: class I SAM-dependent methyltransferase [Elusimicrobia bacterium]|nr:class I SAM-dependent methyltransferase [Elusimicrobiota bacterium]